MRCYSVTKADGSTHHVESVNGAYLRVNQAGDLIVFDALTRVALEHLPVNEWLSVHNARATFQQAENKAKPLDLSPGMAGSPI
jgi:hypothetical protein